MRNLNLLENGIDFDLFRAEVFYPGKDKFKGLIDKISRHGDNFRIVSVENLIEEKVAGGLLNLSGKMEVKDNVDYEMNIVGSSELAHEMIDEDRENIKHCGISRNVGLCIGISEDMDSSIDYYKHYISAERDSAAINRFSGLNAYPLIIKSGQTEDFVKTLQSIQFTFSAIRILHLDEEIEKFIYDRIYSDLQIPVISQYYDELPLCLLTVIFHLFNKNSINYKGSNAGFIGLNVCSLRLTGLFTRLGFSRILGFDNNEKLMHDFERAGGIATTQENILNNSDLIILFKNHLNIDDLYKIGSGQIILSQLDEEIDGNTLKKKGVREFMQGRQDLSVVTPGLLKGMIGSDVKYLDDAMLINLSKLILSEKQDEIMPGVFSGVHDRISDYILNVFQTQGKPAS